MASVLLFAELWRENQVLLSFITYPDKEIYLGWQLSSELLITRRVGFRRKAISPISCLQCMFYNPKETSMPGPPVVKLRDSCESCAASKVRCTKEKPTCNRCAERGMDCLYSVQQRTGRKFRRRDSINSNMKDVSSSKTISPLSSTSPFFPDLDTAAGFSVFDPAFGVPDPSTSLSTSSDGFKLSQSTTDSLSPPVQSSQNPLSHPTICPDQTQDYAAGNCALTEAMLAFRSYEGPLSATSEMSLDGEEFGLSSLTCSFPTVQLSTRLGAALDVTGSQQPDSLETALRLMRQLSYGEDHLSPASLITTGHDHQATEISEMQIVIEKNKKAMEAVRSTLQTTCSQDGYFLVVVCLVVSKVLSGYTSAVRLSCARENDRRTWNASASSTSLGHNDPIAAQRVLDELYQVQASMDQLGAKMQLWAKRNRTSSSEAFSIGIDTSHTTLAGFPFSATVLNQLYTEVRKCLSSLSLELIDELKRYWK